MAAPLVRFCDIVTYLKKDLARFSIVADLGCKFCEGHKKAAEHFFQCELFNNQKRNHLKVIKELWYWTIPH